MTPEQMSGLTLADLEQIAERYANAVRVIRDAQSLLSGAPQQPAYTPEPVRPVPPSQPLGPVTAAAIRWDPAEQMKRAQLLSQFAQPEPPEAK
jgi:hypothetical protein